MAVKTNKDLITSLNLKPNQTFLVNKYKMQAKYFEEKELKEILQNLRDLDYNYKIGLIDLQVGLESILCRYCSWIKNNIEKRIINPKFAKNNCKIFLAKGDW